ncbi:hypothetical protein E4U43_000994 [Claviceps pusilla]|uniref:ABC transporter domain-containing protein n=1 Tax=Claviceps pusilla TaxID=123648 RepID=A0A9P7T3K3_9HYPO|nr:hypothetical protein E4U43_000994 [Claviceps pusilla]
MQMSSANSSCLSGALPLRLSTHNTCNPGFYCPNNTESEPPQFCAPSAACLVTRLQSVQNICPEPQGNYEPLICPPGKYCRAGGREMQTCPRGYFCPLGTAEPFRCGKMSVCPAGARKEFVMDGFIVLIVVDLTVLFFLLKPGRRMVRLLRQRVFGLVERRKERSLLGVEVELERQTEPAMDITAAATATTPACLPREPHPWHRGEDTRDDHHHSTGTKENLNKLVASVKRCVESNEVGMSFAFNGISLTLDDGKEILAPQFGHFDKGTLWGVMGPSGAGKSTFVNAVMGKTAITAGDIYVNQIPCHVYKFKKLIGHVPQDDIIMPELTVRENIMHAARIRLPSRWTDAECNEYVDTLVACLGLSHVQDNIVGDQIHSAVSGGQRKRVSIGIELAAAPMALFLDEPTSGLDATAALSVMGLLKTISQLGVTIVCIIHQPRREILEALDGIHLLGGGCQVYHGKASGVADYFESMGFSISGLNIGDAVLDIISGRTTTTDTANNKSVPRLNINDLEQQWRSQPRPDQVPSDLLAELGALSKSASSRGALWHKQVHLCFVRGVKQQWYRQTSFVLEVSVGSIAGLLIGLSLYKLDGRHFQGIYVPPFELLSSAVSYTLVPLIGMLCSLCIGLAAAAPGVKVFGEESIYGLASIMSMLVRREDGPLMAMIVCLIIGVFSGYGPPLYTVKEWHLEWFWRLCPGMWLTEAYYDQHLLRLGYLYDLQHAADWTGYVRGRFHVDVLLLLVIGTVYRVIAFGCLVFFDRAKQR